MSTPNMCDDCGVSQGDREWCEYCGLDTSPPHASRNDSKGPLRVSEPLEAEEPLYSLTRLSERHIGAIVKGLWDTIHHEYSEETDREHAHAVLQLIAESDYFF